MKLTKKRLEELEGSKKCTMCHQRLDIGFFRHKTKPSLKGCHYASWCRTCENDKSKNNYKLNISTKREYQRAYNKKNKKEIRLKDYSLKFVLARCRRKKEASPPWLTKEDKTSILLCYKNAKALSKLGIKHEVDHIIPLNHADVCGLHVPWNLRVIPASENNRKSNSLDFEILRSYYPTLWIPVEDSL
jgi:hypothetical protein